MRRVPIILILLGVMVSTARAMLWTNSVSDLPTFQTAINGMGVNDTMYVTNVGTANWAGVLSITNDIRIFGMGIDQTIIQDTNASASTLIQWTTSSNHFDIISGFTFKGVTNLTTSSALITIGGTCHSFRVSTNKFNLVNEINVQFTGWVYGVVDHCTFWRNNVFGIQVHHDTYGGGTNMYGDGSWADADNWGTTNAVYIESCTFTNSYAAPGMFDTEDGGRLVFRYNYSTNDSPGFHGTETGQRLRSARLLEFYNNTNYWDTNVNSSGSTGFVIRGGTLVIFSNFWYNYKTIGDMIAYRVTPNQGQWTPWLNADGFNNWDTNVSGSYPSGTATSTTTNYVVDSTKSWTVNQWATNVGAYVVEDTTTGNAGAITTNGATTLYFVGNHQGVNIVTTFGDAYKIGYVYQVLDQPGVGQSHLIADTVSGNGIPFDTVTGKTNYSNAFDPIYEWSNSIVMPLQNGLSSFLVADHTVVITNVDYIDGVSKPGYTPLVFPHPLVGSFPPAPPPPTYKTTPFKVFVNTNSGGGGSFALVAQTNAAGATTGAINTTGASLLTVGYDAESTATVSDNEGNTYTVCCLATNLPQGLYSYIAYKTSPTVGASHTVTISGTCFNVQFAAWSDSGSPTLDATSTNSAISNASTVQPGSITPGKSGELFFCNAYSGTASTASVNQSFTLLATNITCGAVMAGSYNINSGSGALNPTTTWNSSAGWTVAGMAAFKP